MSELTPLSSVAVPEATNVCVASRPAAGELIRVVGGRSSKRNASIFLTALVVSPAPLRSNVLACNW